MISSLCRYCIILSSSFRRKFFTDRRKSNKINQTKKGALLNDFALGKIFFECYLLAKRNIELIPADVNATEIALVGGATRRDNKKSNTVYRSELTSRLVFEIFINFYLVTNHTHTHGGTRQVQSLLPFTILKSILFICLIQVYRNKQIIILDA